MKQNALQHQQSSLERLRTGILDIVPKTTHQRLSCRYSMRLSGTLQACAPDQLLNVSAARAFSIYTYVTESMTVQTKPMKQPICAHMYIPMNILRPLFTLDLADNSIRDV